MNTTACKEKIPRIKNLACCGLLTINSLISHLSSQNFILYFSYLYTCHLEWMFKSLEKQWLIDLQDNSNTFFRPKCSKLKKKRCEREDLISAWCIGLRILKQWLFYYGKLNTLNLLDQQTFTDTCSKNGQRKSVHCRHSFWIKVKQQILKFWLGAFMHAGNMVILYGYEHFPRMGDQAYISVIIFF